MSDLTTMLTEVETAIRTLVTGAKSYSISGRTVTRENLAELRAWRRDLKEEIDATSGSSPMFVRGRVTGIGEEASDA